MDLRSNFVYHIGAVDDIQLCFIFFMDLYVYQLHSCRIIISIINSQFVHLDICTKDGQMTLSIRVSLVPLKVSRSAGSRNNSQSTPPAYYQLLLLKQIYNLPMFNVSTSSSFNDLVSLINSASSSVRKPAQFKVNLSEEANRVHHFILSYFTF